MSSKLFSSFIAVFAIIASAAFIFACKAEGHLDDSGGTAKSKTYIITVNSAAVSADKTSAEEGETITISPQSGKKIIADSVKAKKTSGGEAAIASAGGTWIFTMPASDVTIEAVFLDDTKVKANGGIVSFIQSASSPSGWDEIHTFTYEDAGSAGGTIANGQAAYNFVVSGAINNAQVLVVAGGGGGGAGKNEGSKRGAGGGGAGKLIYSAGWTIPSGTLEIKVGQGGNGTAGGTQSNTTNNNGKPSSIKVGNDTLTADGGGAGGSSWGGMDMMGFPGGSGGGGTWNLNVGGNASNTTMQSIFSSFTAYGYKGGSPSALTKAPGGGGGAAEIGKDGNNNTGGNGGAGKSFDISGAEVYYAGGGGGGMHDGVTANCGKGGQGGGGAWSENGAPGTGGGGGGGDGAVHQSGGNGGSGIVIIRFPWVAP